MGFLPLGGDGVSQRLQLGFQFLDLGLALGLARTVVRCPPQQLTKFSNFGLHGQHLVLCVAHRSVERAVFNGICFDIRLGLLGLGDQLECALGSVEALLDRVAQLVGHH